MNATLLLFRDDVRRLRWWLLAWGLFWCVMLAQSGQHEAGPADLSSAIASFSSHWFQPVVVMNVLHSALLALLVALLILPHGPEDPRLFWRTRPIAARDVLRAKALFIGLFLVVFPAGAELVFWLGWLPVRDARRYQLAVAGLLGLGLVWTYAFDQFLYAHWETTGEESLLPGLAAEGGLRQLWEFFAKGPNRSVFAPEWLSWIPAVVLGVGGWVVVGCRYLTRGWRATRIVGLLALLMALVAGHVGVAIERWTQHEDVSAPF